MKLLYAKNFFSVAILLVFFHVSSSLTAQSIAYKALLSTLYDSDFPVLKPDQLSDLSKYQVLDTREKVEFDVSHLKGAEWVGYDTFNLENVEALDKNKPVLVYCTVGARSQNIGKKLIEAGFTQVYNLYGGLIEWSNKEKPIFQGDSPTKKVHTYTKSWGIWLTKGEKVY
ncbi:rhodanese-related sulfurtransferase [Algoriphagus ratkowskyi]|uniref:Rhodanese-like domain-containing protein n=1 Tax=Algoriphagus ratkowskyi TaxID=57028 RepID=A0A2W7TCR3_9BACT|nr:rhodanese-like domain-containing protein [Algoriphagus ratkowskyi]PZX61072.1 rhodanese-related sulfurtransferase [Algoriphagus ratkowskyi]TXD79207.1 rhodanese-like domain-containing protein [Algoriphagus ratkowskyi]